MSDALSGIEKYKVTKSMMNEYLDIMRKMDPESVEEIEILKQDNTLDFTAATMYNWYKSAIGYAIKLSNEAMISQLSSNYQEAKNAIDLDDISEEISGLYNCAFEFKKAELDLESIAKMSNEPFEEGSLTKMQSNIDRFSSSIKYAITRAFGMLTSTAKYLKDKVIELKNISKNFTSKVKDEFINTYNKIVKYFFQLIYEFVSKLFSVIEVVNQVGKSKGFSLKSANISFNPPTFNNVSVFGFSIPVPTISLPKLDINFETKVDKIQTNSENKEQMEQNKVRNQQMPQSISKNKYLYIKKWNLEGSTYSNVTYNQGIAIDSSDDVYVTNHGIHRIQKFDSRGNFITTWRSQGTEDGQLESLTGIAVDSAGNVYVTDPGNNCIQVFSPSS